MKIALNILLRLLIVVAIIFIPYLVGHYSVGHEPKEPFEYYEVVVWFMGFLIMVLGGIIFIAFARILGWIITGK